MSVTVLYYMSVANPRLYTYTFFMINFKFSPGIFCPKHGIHFWHAYSHFLTCLGLETTKQFSITKAKHNYKSAKSAVWYYLYTSPYISRKIELMHIADSSRIVVSA